MLDIIRYDEDMSKTDVIHNNSLFYPSLKQISSLIFILFHRSLLTISIPFKMFNFTERVQLIPLEQSILELHLNMNR